MPGSGPGKTTHFDARGVLKRREGIGKASNARGVDAWQSREPLSFR